LTLGIGVGRRHGAVGDEDEQMRPDLGRGPAQFESLGMSRLQPQEHVQAPVQIGSVLAQGAVLEVRPSALQEITAKDAADQQGGVKSNLSTVAAGRMEATEAPRAPLSPGAASSGRKSKARRKDAT
jgi:hypothetical protein